LAAIVRVRTPLDRSTARTATLLLRATQTSLYVHRSLRHAQCDDRIDAGYATSWYICREHGHHEKHRCDHRERRWIERRNAEEHAPQVATQRNTWTDPHPLPIVSPLSVV
jgi:hypothetical protein